MSGIFRLFFVQKIEWEEYKGGSGFIVVCSGVASAHRGGAGRQANLVGYTAPGTDVNVSLSALQAISHSPDMSR